MQNEGSFSLTFCHTASRNEADLWAHHVEVYSLFRTLSMDTYLERSNIFVLLTVLAASFVAIRLYKRSGDPYGSFHLGLNLLPGESEAKTEWLNMGYWKVSCVFRRVNFYPLT